VVGVRAHFNRSRQSTFVSILPFRGLVSLHSEQRRTTTRRDQICTKKRGPPRLTSILAQSATTREASCRNPDQDEKKTGFSFHHSTIDKAHRKSTRADRPIFPRECDHDEEHCRKKNKINERGKSLQSWPPAAAAAAAAAAVAARGNEDPRGKSKANLMLCIVFPCSAAACVWKPNPRQMRGAI